MNTCIEQIVRQLSVNEQHLPQIESEMCAWDAMTETEFADLSKRQRALGLYEPDSLESERQEARGHYDELLRWIEDANMVLAVWYASAAAEG